MDAVGATEARAAEAFQHQVQSARGNGLQPGWEHPLLGPKGRR